jgi:parallel beta-helix repeat protein
MSEVRTEEVSRMKKRFAVLVTGMLVFAGLIGAINLASDDALATNVSGPISVDTTWDIGGSPYIVVGNVTVMNGITLTIDPGVEVRFDGNYSLSVDGTLDAIGSNANMIAFTSNSLTPAWNDWLAIFVNSTGTATMDYCSVSYSMSGIFLNNTSDNLIAHSVITANNLTGVYLFESTNNEISNNSISANGMTGIFSFNSSFNDIIDNDIVGNLHAGMAAGYGLYFFNTGNTNVLNNNISFNGMASSGNIIAMDASDNTFRNNEIFGADFGMMIMSALLPSSGNTIRNNEIGSHTTFGISLMMSNDNEFYTNNISSNGFGISLMMSSGNLLHHNNMIENTFQAMDDSNANRWNESYANGGGNYWSHFDEVAEGCIDNFDGATTPQTTGSSDGICDVQMDIDADSTDFYPLVQPWGGGVPPVDTTGPSITNLQPGDLSTTSDNTPTISAEYSDPAGIDVGSVRLEVNGTDVTSLATITASGISFTPSASMADGTHDVYLEVNDTLGNQATRSWSFTVDTSAPSDTTPPTITGLQPANQSTSNDNTPTISADFSDDTGIDIDSVKVIVDGNDVTASATIDENGMTYTPSLALSDGEHTVYIEVMDNSTSQNEANVTWSFTVDTSDIGPGPTEPGDFLSEFWWLLLLIIVMVVVLLLVLLLIMRKKKPQAAGPQTQTTEVNTYQPKS